jgi:predicted Zn finger-like uncharacterized protein
MSQVSDSVKSSCPHCSARIRLPEDAAGKRVRCPKCKEPFRVPATKPAASPAPKPAADALSSLSDNILRFPCDDCGAKLKAKAESVGKRVKCRKCGSIMRVPDPNPPKQEPAEESDNLDLLGLGEESSMLDALESSETGGDVVGVGRVCPSCATQLPSDAKLCTMCGYNFSTGGHAKMASVAAETASGGGSKLKLKVSMPPFLLGCLLSMGGALIGGAIWFTVAYITHFEIGFIAWAVGALAGGGMAYGYRDANGGAGAAAAVIAVAGIVLAKFVLFTVIFWPLVPLMSLDGDDMAVTSRDRLANQIADDYMEHEFSELDPNLFDERYEQEFDTALEDAKRDISELSDDEVNRDLLVHILLDERMDSYEIYEELDDLDLDENEYHDAYNSKLEEIRITTEAEVAALEQVEVNNQINDSKREDLIEILTDIEAIELEIEEGTPEYNRIRRDKSAEVDQVLDDELDDALVTASHEYANALSKVMQQGMSVLFFATMFKFRNILWFALAVATAYGIGSSGM